MNGVTVEQAAVMSTEAVLAAMVPYETTPFSTENQLLIKALSRSVPEGEPEVVERALSRQYYHFIAIDDLKEHFQGQRNFLQVLMNDETGEVKFVKPSLKFGDPPREFSLQAGCARAIAGYAVQWTYDEFTHVSILLIFLTFRIYLFILFGVGLSLHYRLLLYAHSLN